MEKGWVQVSVKPYVYIKLEKLKQELNKKSMSEVIAYLIEEYEKKQTVPATQ